MASMYYVHSDSIGSGVQINAAAEGDIYLIMDDVYVISGSTNAIYSAVDYTVFSIDGHVSGFDAIYLYNYYSTVTISSTGVIANFSNSFEDLDAAITLYSGNVNNQGSIQSASTGIANFYGWSTVRNGGTIDAAHVGIYVGGYTLEDNQFDVRVVNNGVISAGSGILDSDWSNRGAGIFAPGSYISVFNGKNAVIETTGANSSAVTFGASDTESDGDNLLNYGEIFSAYGWGVLATNTSEDSYILIRNFGTISGWDGAVATADGGDTINNHGVLDGQVYLGGGDDYYVNRYGICDYWVYGDAGADTLLGGSNDDFLSGGEDADFLKLGAGDDQAYGGAGADTFFIVKGSGEDIIRDFTRGVDHLNIERFEGKSFKEISSAITYKRGIAFIDLDELGGDGVLVLDGIASGLNSKDFIF